MMRAFLLSVFILLTTIPLFAQLEVGMAYVNGSPFGLMGQTMRQMHGAHFHAGYLWPTTRITTGIEFGISGYGNVNQDIDLVTSQGGTISVDMNVSSTVFNLGAVTQYYITNHKVINPYISARAGWARFATNLTLSESGTSTNGQDDVFDSDRLAGDNGFIYGMGAGLRMDLAFSTDFIDRNTLFLDISLNYNRGTTVEYMSVKSPLNDFTTDTGVESFAHLLANPDEPWKDSDLYSSLLFKTPYEVLDFRIGVLYRFVRGAE